MEDLLEEIGKELLPSQSRETYQTIAKILGNILNNPGEVKFRSLKKDNKAIAEKVLRSNHAASLLLAIGFEDDGAAYRLPQDADLEVIRTCHDMLECLVMSSAEEESVVTPAAAQQPAPVAAAVAVPAVVAAVAAAPAPTAKPGAALGATEGFMRRNDAEAKRQAQTDQLQAARAAQRAQYVENPQGPPALAAAAAPTGTLAPAAEAAGGYPANASDTAKKNNKPTAFDFKDRGKAEQEKAKAAMSLEEIRKAQKDKFKAWEADPNAKKQEAYHQPPSVAGGAQADTSWGGWFGGMFGGGSSSNTGSSKPSQQPERRKPNIKGVGDLPKPVQRGGG